MDIDITQALKDAENALRDFISNILMKQFGADWIKQCAIPHERIEIWKERKTVEEKRQKFGTVEERLIYYADFYDLKNILHKNWAGEFKEVLGDWKTMEVWLDELGRLRDPDAHRRELLPHQKHLAAGIVGEIRTRIVRYRSKQETAEDYFPKIEYARDNFGNIFPSNTGNSVYTRTILRPNDIVDFVITASDPLDADLEYRIAFGRFRSNDSWQKENTFSVRIMEEHIEKSFTIIFTIRSPRMFHAHSSYDDSISFVYDVLPLKKA